MHVRPATESDLEPLKALWLAFEREQPTPEYEDVDEAVELSEVEEYVRDHIALRRRRTARWRRGSCSHACVERDTAGSAIST